MFVPCTEVVGEFVGGLRECADYLMVCLNCNRISVRTPALNALLYENGGTLLWHRDGDFGHGRQIHAPYSLVVWSNRASSEVVDSRVFPDRKQVPADAPVLRFKPYEIVLIRNKYAWHRTPARLDPEREFIRVWGPAMTDVRRLREALAQRKTGEPSGSI